jgi:hypothetical protein
MTGPVEIATTVGVDDWVAYVMRDQRAHLARTRRTFVRWIVGLVLLVPMSLALLTGLKLLAGQPWNGLLRGPDVLAWSVAAGGAVGLAGYLVWHLLMTGPFLERRLTRWAIAEHGPNARSIGYRFDADGIAAADERGHSWTSWDRVAAIEAASDAIYLVGRDGHVIPIPTRGASEADVAALQALAAAHLRGGRDAALAPPMLPPSVQGPGTVTADLVPSLEDEAAALLLLWSMPHPRRQQRRSCAFLVLAFTLVPMILMAAAAVRDWRRYPSGRPLWQGVLDHTDGGSWLWMAAAAGCAVGLLFVAAYPWELRWKAMSLARRTSPVREPTLVAAGPVGLAVARPGATWQSGWDAVRKARETSSHIGFVLEMSLAVVVPKRALDAASLATLRELAARHVPPRRGE